MRRFEGKKRAATRSRTARAGEGSSSIGPLHGGDAARPSILYHVAVRRNLSKGASGELFTHCV
jgi:hypothetical protein